MVNKKNQKILSFIIAAIIFMLPAITLATQITDLNNNKSSIINQGKPFEITTVDGKKITILDNNKIDMDGSIQSYQKLIELIIEGLLVGLIIETVEGIFVEVVNAVYYNPVNQAYREYKSFPLNIRLQIWRGLLTYNPFSGSTDVTFINVNECVLSRDGNSWICKYSL